MTKYTFYQLLQQKFADEFPEHKVHTTYHEKDFSMDISIDEKNTKLNLQNLYKEYVTNPTMFHFDHIMEPLKRMIGKETSFKHHQLFPVIRGVSETEQGYVAYPLASSIELRFVIDRPDSVTFVTENQLSKELTAEKLYETSFINLIHQGWCSPKTVESTENGRLLVFKEDEKNYQAQFLLSPLYIPHLGERFYVSFPTRSLTLVYVPDSSEEYSLEHLLKVKELAVKMYTQESYPLSDKVFEAKDNKVVYCG